MAEYRQLDINEQLYKYILDISLREDQELLKMRQELGKNGTSPNQSSPEQVQFICFLIKLIRAEKILELGIYKGYSTLAFAKTLPGHGKILACDINQKWADIAKKFWQQAKQDHKIDLRLAPALETLSQLIEEGEGDSFDLIFIDADKNNYETYFEQSLKLVRRGGLIIIDNTLWYGNVIKPEIKDQSTEAIRHLNEKIKNDDRVDISLLPVRDGITLLHKK